MCSGIEAATAAWHPLGWTPVFFSEIDKSASRFLSLKYPEVPNYGDMTKFKEWPDAALDVLVGGTPCQSFSVAGLRKGLADPRGNLMLTYLAIADRYRPEWLVWENVPGVLSSNGGRDFGAFLGGLGELGYGFAYRVLDAQYVRVESHARAVPQRRRRVFVVGCLGDWRRAAAVLFERESLSGHPAPRREAGKGTARDVAPSLVSSGRGVERSGDTRGQDPVVAELIASTGDLSHCLNGGGMGRIDYETETMIAHEVAPTLNAQFGNTQGIEDQHINGGAGLFVAHALRREGFDASEDGTGRGTPIVPVAYSIMPQNSGKDYKARQVDVAQPLMAGGPVGGNQGGDFLLDTKAFDCKGTQVQTDASHQNGGGQLAVMTLAIRGRGDSHNLEYRQDGTANAILTPTGGRAGIGVGAVATQWAVRRLTPLECTRLQGFPDDYFTGLRLNKPFADGPVYKMLGNSMAVNVMSWIGQRIEAVCNAVRV